MQSNIPKIAQWSNKFNEHLLKDEQVLFFINQDFGHLSEGHATAVFKPGHLHELQSFFQFASQKKIPLTLRANGLSQSGQSLAVSGGISVDITNLNWNLSMTPKGLNAGCSVSWKEIISETLKHNQLPIVYPYNTNLTLGGVLSVGGIGSSSFIKGVVAAHVETMQVITATGEHLSVSPTEHKDLFEASLCGAGLFGIIYEAQLKLRSCKKNVYIQTLFYDNYENWVADQFVLKQCCDYLEAFITPEIKNNQRICNITFGIEFDNQPPELDFMQCLRYATLGDSEQKPIWEYVIRHDPRLENMKTSGAWASVHPWYECYIGSEILLKHLPEIVHWLDETVGGIYHVFPIAPVTPAYFMLPQQKDIVTFNVLIPEINPKNSNLAIETLKKIDALLLREGGKRYISGWFPNSGLEAYWSRHYGAYHQIRQEIKKKYDPASVLCSVLFPLNEDE